MYLTKSMLVAKETHLKKNKFHLFNNLHMFVHSIGSPDLLYIFVQMH